MSYVQGLATCTGTPAQLETSKHNMTKLVTLKVPSTTSFQGVNLESQKPLNTWAMIRSANWGIEFNQ